MSIHQIDSLPYVISQPGVYHLARDFVVTLPSGSAIEVKSDGVTLDLMHYSIDNQSAGAGTTANGVHADGYRYCTVRNGRISGFASGISLRPGALAASNAFCAYLVESITASGNIQEGIALRGVGNIVRNNLVSGSQAGIRIGPHGASTVVGNCVYDNVTGIEVSLNVGSVVEHNRIGQSGSPSGSGITIVDSGNIVLRDNSIYNLDHGIHFDPLSWGMYADNIVVHCNVPFMAPHAVAAGTTNYSMP